MNANCLFGFGTKWSLIDIRSVSETFAMGEKWLLINFSEGNNY